MSKQKFAGSIPMIEDTKILAGSETRQYVLDVADVGSIGGDIFGDQASTLKVYYGHKDAAGAITYSDAETLAVSASTLTPFSSTDLFCDKIKIEVVNGATPMTSYKAFVRGRA